MKQTLLWKILAICAAFALLAACTSAPKKVEVDTAKLAMFRPLPAVMESATNPLSEEKISLGRMLYYDKRLSKGQDVSCNTCHKLDNFGVDGEETSEGHLGKRGDRNSPTVFNAAGHFVQFWDGRAPDVEEQAKGPVMNPVEMAMSSNKQVVAVLKSMPGYVEAFQKAFPDDKDPITFDNMAKAIGAFERKLVAPSRWDKFLQGDQAALTDVEKAGFNKYMEAGCQACHAGPYVGAQMYQKIGLVKPWPDTSDEGRFKVTKQEGDKMMFKVPSLRGIEKTGPYYHDGSVKTLDEAVSHMAEYQLGKQVTQEEIASIVAWLKTLTGEVPADYIKEPALPPSTDKTPKPQKS